MIHQKTSYVNGRYMPHAKAAVHIEDRGYQFSDGIYEVIAVYNGKLLDGPQHFARLKRSLSELRIPKPMSIPSMEVILQEMMRRNGIYDGFFYIQVSRGVASRNHALPTTNVKPGVVITLSPVKQIPPKILKKGAGVITGPDIRWSRRDIKSISLLPNVLAKQEAVKAGAWETWQVEKDGVITEGSASNAYIIDKNNVLHTHPANESILGGVTRDSVLRIARKHKIKVSEKPFTLKEALKAKEAFLTSTTAGIIPVTKINDATIANGVPGAITMQLRNLYNSYIEEQTGA